MAVPTDQKLYNRVKTEAKRKFKKWPSAYASGYLVRTYKSRFAKKYPRKQAYKGTKKSVEAPLARWYLEKWVNVCSRDSSGNYKPCGRSRSSPSKYPYCRPLKRITSRTPRTAGEMSAAQRKRMCSKKRKTKPYKGKNVTRVYVHKAQRGGGRNYKLITIKKSTNPAKKKMAIFENRDTGRRKTTHFGAAGMSDYTKHKDSARMQRYLNRHRKRENWNDPTTAGALSRWILWNKPSYWRSCIC